MVDLGELLGYGKPGIRVVCKRLEDDRTDRHEIDGHGLVLKLTPQATEKID